MLIAFKLTLSFLLEYSFIIKKSLIMNMYSPYISVLILVHDRRKYLFDAVNSVLSQDFPREKYEVIIVKYELDGDKETDRKLEELSVRVINTKEASLGAKIAVGAEEAKGEVLAFLEDDDLFLPGKLSRVYEVLKNDEKIGYYHNEMIFFDVDKNEEIKSRTEFRRKMLLKFNKHFRDDIIIKGMDFWRKIPIISTYFFGFNNSSIAVKKDVILSFNKVYKSSESNHAIDFLHFLLSLELGYLPAMDGKALTIYRIHSNSTMVKKNMNFEDYVKNEINVKEIQIKNLSLPFLLYKLTNTNKFLKTLRSYMELVKYSYENALGLKTYPHKLSIIIFLLRNDKSFIYSRGLLFFYIYGLLPSTMERMLLKYSFERHNNSV